ncbi:MAG: TIGR01212 family radical SAM protein [Planctomycetes bacterium]|nr:TIGR01212 family radical SAM protein [Planctomycetota bacterium]
MRVRKLCLQAGFTCPNLDGTVAKGGCAWCDNRGFSPGLQLPSLERQWERGRDALRRRHRRVDGFIAYLQSFSNTYAPVEHLRTLYARFPADFPECVGLSIGSRPDCVPDEVLDLLAETAQRTFTTLELGLQSDRDAVLRRMNRGHTVAQFLDAVRRAAARRLELCAHVILGLPGEGDDAPERLGTLLAGLPVASVKIHNLHVMRGTPLERMHLPELPRPEYVDRAARLIARLRHDQALQRVVADAPDAILASGGWCHDKQGVLGDLRRRLGSARPDQHAGVPAAESQELAQSVA